MRNLKAKVHEEDWDTLIVLDACRFDFFKHFYEFYPNIENGTLSKVKSPGSATPESVPALFDESYDYTIHSTHPWIRRDSKMKKMHTSGEKWDAESHFKEVYHIDFEISKSVTLPQNVSRYIYRNENDVLNSKSIIWMMQPHAPYVGSVKFNFTEFFPWKLFLDEDGNVVHSMKTLLNVCYKFNLLAALYQVSSAIGEMGGKVAITSDHGEVLCDCPDLDVEFGHPIGKDHAELRHVPWLEVPADKSISLARLNAEDLVKVAYQSVLNRSADSDGLERYSDAISDSTISRQRVFEILMHSDEFKENVGNPSPFTAIAEFEADNPVKRHTFGRSADENSEEIMQRLDALGYR